jgi:hypothetical protein
MLQLAACATADRQAINDIERRHEETTRMLGGGGGGGSGM